MSLSLYLCLLSFALCYWAGRRSLVSGLIAVVGIGYAYGITRANLPETYSHFIFDAGVIGLYAAQLFRKLSPTEHYRVSHVRPWLEFLIAWPFLLFLIPIQHLLVQFVGLRGNVFLLPFIIFGARMNEADRFRLALWIAGFSVLAFAIGAMEYFVGIEHFFPHNHVTEQIYISRDLVGYTQYRIPASFVNAHAYGGTMVVGLPLLIGAVIQKRRTTLHLQLLALGITAALLGVLMSGARTPFLVAGFLIVVATFSLRSRIGYAIGWVFLLCTIAWVVSGEERLQRFMQLRDTDSVIERISGSVNMGFLEIAREYPFGNGLGGGGTSIPYFLQGSISNPVTMENEYARIMLEQGIAGLVVWIAFIFWVATRLNQNAFDSWYLGRRLALVACMVSFLTGLTGIGLLTSVPHSCLLLLLVGWVGARQTKTALAQPSTKYANTEIQAPVEQYG